jgi:hypothetical protein
LNNLNKITSNHKITMKIKNMINKIMNNNMTSKTVMMKKNKNMKVIDILYKKSYLIKKKINLNEIRFWLPSS